MLTKTWKNLSLALLLIVPAASTLAGNKDDIETRLTSDGLGGKFSYVIKFFTTDAEQAEFLDHYNAAAALEIPPRQCLNRLIARKVKANAGESIPSYSEVLRIASQLKADGVSEDRLLPATDSRIQAIETGKQAGINATKQQEAEKKFLGFQWNAGIALSVDLSGRDRVKSAKIVNGILRVEEDSSANAGILWEVHRYWWNNSGKVIEKKKDLKDGETLGKARYKLATRGTGPFVGIQTSQDNLIESFAIGIMHGRRSSIDNDDGYTLNIGLGLIFEPNVLTLKLCSQCYQDCMSVFGQWANGGWTHQRDLLSTCAAQRKAMTSQPTEGIKANRPHRGMEKWVRASASHQPDRKPESRRGGSGAVADTVRSPRCGKPS